MRLMLTIVCFHLISFACTRSFAEDWTQFGGQVGNFQTDAALAKVAGPALRWKREFGDGMSGAVVSGELVYLSYLSKFSADENSKPEADRKHREALVALDRETGKTRWEFMYDAPFRSSQESFGGKARAPQSTPIVFDDCVVTIGFSGIATCVDGATGTVHWQWDLVERFGAIPVQFGFASSPVRYQDSLIMLVGGPRGGLISLDPKTGELKWQLGCDEASYATPVLMMVDGKQQLVFVTRDDIVGVDPDQGTELWRYALPKQGLTNVPTPLVLGDGDFVVSGQGVGGTRRLKIRRSENAFVIEEVWESTMQFFYCNWTELDGMILGCNGKLLIALDGETGKTIGRWRGFAEANIVAAGDQLLAMGDEGMLRVLRVEDHGLRVESCFEVMGQRSWVPPTICGGELFCRAGTNVACVHLAGPENSSRLVQVAVPQTNLPLQRRGRMQTQMTPLDQILAAFEEQGAEAAWSKYVEFRGKSQLSLEDRRTLATLAADQGLDRFARLIGEHAVEDLPEQDAAKQWQHELMTQLEPKPSPRVVAGKNGLSYVEFVIHNDRNERLDTFVKGPDRHPFSYGIPFPTGKHRLERWPVGTRLFEMQKGLRVRTLLTVKADFAGQTLLLSKLAKPSGAREQRTQEIKQ